MRLAVIFRLLILLFCFAAIGASSAKSATPLTTTVVAQGLSSPVFVTSPRGDTARLFVVEKTGTIRIVKSGLVQATPFVNVTTLINSTGSEQGLLGFAFPPNYQTSGYFYMDYTRASDAATVIARGHATPTSDVADVGIETLLVIKQPYANHNGGMIAFGPNDSMLYIGTGDGGSGGDPQNRAQNLDSLLGKILRIDVRTAPGYTVPADNPVSGPTGSPRRLIWAWGLRNPWRFSFDRSTGVLWIGDVGQDTWEEIDRQLASDKSGHNYGWRLKEGLACFNPALRCDTLQGLTNPILAYSHANGRCAITGGYVYRGCAIPDLNGAYFYGDYCTGEIISIRYIQNVITDSVYRVAELGSAVTQADLGSFGEDANGELYIVGVSSGKVSKIVPNGVASACGSTGCCTGSRGNVDNSVDQVVDIADVTELIDYLYISYAPVGCSSGANCDGSLDGSIDIIDLLTLIDHLYMTFTPLPTCS